MVDFDMPRIHKLEEWIEREITEAVYDHVCDWFQVEYVEQLTPKQLADVNEFRFRLNEHSPVQIGFSNLENEWEMQNEST